MTERPIWIRWTAQASEQLDTIYQYIAGDNPPAAVAEVALISKAIRALGNSPQMGRSGRVSGTRELVVAGTPYIIAYRVKPDAVQIIGIYHGAQRWPRSFPQ